MKLLTKTIEKKIPAIGKQDGLDDEAIVHVKFFDPCGSWTWYVLEYDGEDTFFGLIDGHEPEYGYFSKIELESIRRPFGLKIERDLSWRPTKIGAIRTKLR